MAVTRRGEDLMQQFQEAGLAGEPPREHAGHAMEEVCLHRRLGGRMRRRELRIRRDAHHPRDPQTDPGGHPGSPGGGRAHGGPIMADSLQWAMDALDRFPGRGGASMAKDFIENQPVELEGLTGTVIRLGREVDVPTPVNNFLYAILKPAAARIESLRNSRSG